MNIFILESLGVFFSSIVMFTMVVLYTDYIEYILPSMDKSKDEYLIFFEICLQVGLSGLYVFLLRNIIRYLLHDRLKYVTEFNPLTFAAITVGPVLYMNQVNLKKKIFYMLKKKNIKPLDIIN